MQVGANGYSGYNGLLARGNAAQEEGPAPYKVLEKLDTDKSGGLSVEELKETELSRLVDNFEVADKDESGSINSEELVGFFKSERASEQVSLAETVIRALTALTEALNEIVEDYTEANGVAPSEGEGVEGFEDAEFAGAEGVEDGEAVAGAGLEDAELGVEDPFAGIEDAEVIEVASLDELTETSEDLEDAEIAALNAAKEAAETEARAEADAAETVAAFRADSLGGGLPNEDAVLTLFGNIFEVLKEARSTELGGPEFAQGLYAEVQDILDEAS